MAYRLDGQKWRFCGMADFSKFRGMGHNLEELARGPLSIRKISENDKITTFSRLSGINVFE